MAKYTIEINELVNRGYQIFDDSWTTFDPQHKPELISKILRHYWFYEIGQETPDRFRHYINEQLALTMPYYNKLYASELLRIEPLYNTFMQIDKGTGRALTANKATADFRDVVRLQNMAASLRALDVNNTRDVGNLIGHTEDDGTKNVVGTEDWHEAWKMTRDLTMQQGVDVDQTQDTNHTKDITGTLDKTVDGTLDRTLDMTKNETSDGTKDSTAHQSTSSTETVRHSDTPQKNLGATETSINEAYLTDYRRTTASSSSDSSQNDVMHTQTDTTQKDTEKQTTKDTTDQDTTEKETFKEDVTLKRGENTDRTESEPQTKDGTKHTDYTEDTSTHDTGWKTEDTKTTRDYTGDTKTFQSGQEDESTRQSGTSASDSQERERTDENTIMKGINMVSQAELLQKYRDSFINIDQMIVDSLAINFMGVF